MCIVQEALGHLGKLKNCTLEQQQNIVVVKLIFCLFLILKKITAVYTKLLTTQTPSPRGQRLFVHGVRVVNDYAPTESAKLSTIRRDTNLREIETFRETILV